MENREALRKLYGPKVDEIPDGATIIEYEFPDGSGSWVHAIGDQEVSDAINEFMSQGATVWLGGADN